LNLFQELKDGIGKISGKLIIFYTDWLLVLRHKAKRNGICRKVLNHKGTNPFFSFKGECFNPMIEYGMHWGNAWYVFVFILRRVINRFFSSTVSSPIEVKIRLS